MIDIIYFTVKFFFMNLFIQSCASIECTLKLRNKKINFSNKTRMETRSMTKANRLGISSKLFNFPLIASIEKNIRKEKKMQKLSKGITFTSTVHSNEKEHENVYDEILTTRTATVHFQPNEIVDKLELAGFQVPPPPLPPKSKNKASPPPPLPAKPKKKAPPKPARLSLQRCNSQQWCNSEQKEKKNRKEDKLLWFSYKSIFWFLCIVLLVAVSGVCYQKYQSNQEETRYQTIVLDKKTMTYKFN